MTENNPARCGTDDAPPVGEELDRYRAALACIDRMCIYPNDKINTITLNSAIRLAHRALCNGCADCRGALTP